MQGEHWQRLEEPLWTPDGCSLAAALAGLAVNAAPAAAASADRTAKHGHGLCLTQGLGQHLPPAAASSIHPVTHVPARLIPHLTWPDVLVSPILSSACSTSSIMAACSCICSSTSCGRQGLSGTGTASPRLQKGSTFSCSVSILRHTSASFRMDSALASFLRSSCVAWICKQSRVKEGLGWGAHDWGYALSCGS